VPGIALSVALGVCLAGAWLSFRPPDPDAEEVRLPPGLLRVVVITGLFLMGSLLGAT
jgi:hypothetical protein